MSIMLTAIKVDRLEGFSETMLIAHDTETGIMVCRNLEIEHGEGSEWRTLPPVPMRFVSGGDLGESSYRLLQLPTPEQQAEIDRNKAARLRTLESDIAEDR
jgi:hypothetical protein